MGLYPSVGNVARLSCTFTDQAGTPTDPTTVTVMVHPPAGSTITAAPTRDSTGVYHYDVTLTTSGVWRYHFTGTGAVIAQTADGRLIVPDPTFA